MKKTVSISKQRKEKFEYNRQFILQVGQVTDRDYRAFWHELGCSFLEVLYPRDQYQNYYWLHVSSPAFWAWWKAEYKKWENEFMCFVTDHHLKPNLPLLQDQLNQMAHDGYVEISFQHNYLKFCKLV